MGIRPTRARASASGVEREPGERHATATPPSDQLIDQRGRARKREVAVVRLRHPASRRARGGRVRSFVARGCHGSAPAGSMLRRMRATARCRRRERTARPGAPRPKPRPPPVRPKTRARWTRWPEPAPPRRPRAQRGSRRSLRLQHDGVGGSERAHPRRVLDGPDRSLPPPGRGSTANRAQPFKEGTGSSTSSMSNGANAASAASAASASRQVPFASTRSRAEGPVPHGPRRPGARPVRHPPLHLRRSDIRTPGALSALRRPARREGSSRSPQRTL